MAVGQADLTEAIVTAWNNSGLNDTFKALWSSSYPTEFSALLDQEAPGEQPFPYCVLDSLTASVASRMSSNDTSIREERNVSIRFNVHAREIESDSRSCKEIAAFLMGEVLKVFGGHPEVSPMGAIVLTYGNHLLTQYVSDFGVSTGEDEYQWIINYTMKIDVPVAV